MPIARRRIAALVHRDGRAPEAQRAGCELFVIARLATLVFVAIFVPRYLDFAGASAVWRFGALAWLVLPLAAIAHLARTGDLVEAQLISLFGLAVLALIVTVGAGLSPELSLGWLMLLPLEAAISGSSSMLRFASLLAIALMLALAAAQSAGWLGGAPTMSPGAVATLGAPFGAYAALHLWGERLRRKRRQRADAANSQRYLVLSNTIGDLLMRHDANGDVVAASGDTGGLFGLKAESLFGRGFFDRIHVADRPAYLAAFHAAIHNDATTTVTARLAAGASAGGEPSYAWTEIRFRRFAPDARRRGDAAVAMSVARDVTQAKVAEAKVETARAEAELANAWKDRLLANVGHELRTPLNAILGFSEMLGDPALAPSDPAKRREYARIIHASAEHLLSVVDLILDSSKIAAGTFRIAPEPFAVAPLIAECCDMLRLKAEARGVELVVASLAGVGEIVADKRACRQILLNLIANAVKFTGASGQVVVGVEVVGETMHFTVSDTGIGIPPEGLSRIGAPFVQLRADYDRDYEGAGLGLSLVRGLVGLHGGRLRVESAPGVGTRVTACLPLNCEEAVVEGAAAPLETTSCFDSRGASCAPGSTLEKKIA
jgi:cell cycle sensor histidine kinase DivJ